MNTERIDPVGAQPTDPPWWRLLFLLVQGRDGQWWRGFLLLALTGLLLVVALLVAAGVGGVLGAGLLPALVVAWRRRRHSGRR